MKRRILALLVVFVLIAAACGDDDSDSSSSNVVGDGDDAGDDGDDADVDAGDDADAVEIETISLTARCKGSPTTEFGRCQNLVDAVDSANAELEAAGDNRRIEVNAIQDDLDWGEYKTEFELASAANEAPDIIVSGHEHIGDWATAGLLYDITDDIGDFSQLDDVIDGLWPSTELNGSRWGVPQDAEARPMFYSKILLAELGWSDDEIDGLADRINSGDYTLGR